LFNLDAKVRAQIAKHVTRVLLIDPNPGAVRLLTDLLKDLGTEERAAAATTRRALQIAADFAPQLILCELSGPDLDAVEFIRTLRRSTLACRQAPVIVLSAEARETSIKSARDAGAHEFLCKPFTAGALFKRVENVTLKPRPWIEARMYVGPDRRRFNSGAFEGDKKRRDDKAFVVAA